MKPQLVCFKCPRFAPQVPAPEGTHPSRARSRSLLPVQDAAGLCVAPVGLDQRTEAQHGQGRMKSQCRVTEIGPIFAVDSRRLRIPPAGAAGTAFSFPKVPRAVRSRAGGRGAPVAPGLRSTPGPNPLLRTFWAGLVTSGAGEGERSAVFQTTSHYSDVFALSLHTPPLLGPPPHVSVSAFELFP